MDKLAYYKEQIHKQAMEKQAKGWLRNTAINVAQDFVSAGNPLNPSSPALAQDNTLPCVSLIVTIVLLKLE